jgi:hypothetical protein
MTRTNTKPARGDQGTTSAPVERRQEQPQANDRHRPVHEVRIGSIKAAVWANDGAQGVFYNVTLSRVYRDRQGAWQTASTFGRDDLLVVAKVADLAHSWICEQAQGPGQDAGEGTG